jgi:3'(2'), 5'-bisphosphate nucleotidase
MLDTIDLNGIVDLAKEAGDAIMEIYAKNFTVAYKDDKSPLTEADLKSNEIICKRLNALYPDIPILSEENKEVSYGQRKNWDYFWLIDPIDGTKEFIKKTGEFAVNIALIHQNRPVLGVVYAPVLEDIYFSKKDMGAYKNNIKLPITMNKEKAKTLNVVASVSHLSAETQAFIDTLAVNTEHLNLVSKGSSLKLCMVAEGTADIYPRLAPTMEWDTGAAHAIVLESGKDVVQYENDEPLVYNKENLLNPWFVVK